MKLDQMIGQMLIVGFRGDDLPRQSVIYKDLSERKLGGVILFDRDVLSRGPRNILGPDQLKSLSDKIQRAGGGDVLISIDAEGGGRQSIQGKVRFY